MRMKTKPGKRTPSGLQEATTHLRNYETVTEAVDRAMPLLKTHRHLRYTTDGSDAAWVGRRFESVDGVRTATYSEWPKGLKLLNEMRDKLAGKLPDSQCIRRVREWDEYDGDDFDQDRARNGETPWRATRRRAVSQTRSITIAFTYGANSGVKSDDMMWLPAAAVALADLLEKAGYSVKLIAVRVAKHSFVNRDDSAHSIVLKRDDQPVDESLLANVCTGWFFRTVGLALVTDGEQQARCSVDSGFGSGITTFGHRLTPDEVDPDYTPACKFFELQECHNEHDALAAATALLKRIEDEV